jgi:phage terminase small subunit
MRELTLRQEAFCQAFIRCGGNLSLAYQESGYSTKSGGITNFSKLLTVPRIRARIEAIRAGIAQKHEITRERLISELEAIAFANIADHLTFSDQTLTVYDLGDLTRSQASAVQEVIQIETADGTPALRVKFHDKLTAIGLLAKMLGYTGEDPKAFRAFVVRTPFVATSTGEWLEGHSDRGRLPSPPKLIEGPAADVERLPDRPSSSWDVGQ